MGIQLLTFNCGQLSAAPYIEYVYIFLQGYLSVWDVRGKERHREDTAKRSMVAFGSPWAIDQGQAIDIYSATMDRMTAL